MISIDFHTSQVIPVATAYSFMTDFTCALRMLTESDRIMSEALVKVKGSSDTAEFLEDVTDQLEEVLAVELGVMKEFRLSAACFCDSCGPNVMRAVYMFNDIRNKILRYCHIGRTLNLQELADYSMIFRFCAAELANAMLMTFGYFDIEDTQDSEWMATQGIQAFLADNDLDLKNYLIQLEEISDNFSGLLAVRVCNPELWAQYQAVISTYPDMYPLLTEYDDQMTALDCKAVISGLIPPDETLLELMEARAAEIQKGEDIRDTVPHQFSQFLMNIPDQYSDILLRFEKDLTDEFVWGVIGGQIVIDDHLMESLAKRQEKPADGQTKLPW